MMKALSSNALTLIILFLSCNRPVRDKIPISTETPKALQEENIIDEIESFSKRGKNDLVDALYQEVVAEKADLKEIETLMKKDEENAVEAVNNFERYDNKSQEYYFSAKDHLKDISDSVLRAKMLAVINASSQKYQNKTDQQRALAGQMTQQSLTTSDYYEALKVLITIPLIEKYQDDNLPKDSIYLPILRDQKELVGKIKKKVENPGLKKP